MRTIIAAAAVVLVLVAQGATGIAQTGAPAAGGGAAAPDIENGRKVFAFGNTSCSNCHGNGAIGGFGPDLAGKGLPLNRVAQAIRRPIWRMPAFDNTQVTDKEMADMTAYFNSLPATEKIGAWRTPFPKEPEEGQVLAVTYGCTQCHGNTLDTPRHGQGEVDGDFAWFKHMVYEHSKAQPEQWAMLDRETAPSSTPGPGRVRMGNFDTKRLPEETLQKIYDWAMDLGKLVPISARVAVAPGTGGTTYTVDVANGAVPNKGLTAEDVTISLIVPAGMKVVSNTGAGYQGVKKQGNNDVATWKVAKFAPRDRQKFSVTLSGTAAAANEVPRGTIGWAKPAAKEDAEVNFSAPRPGGGRGGAPAGD
jgi:mono/diheme cytochrome c family protein